MFLYTMTKIFFLFLCFAGYSNMIAMEKEADESRKLLFQVPRLTDIAARAQAKKMVQEYQNFGIDQAATNDLKKDIVYEVASIIGNSKEQCKDINKVPVEVKPILERHIFDAFFAREGNKEKRWKYNLKVEADNEYIKTVFFHDGKLTFRKRWREQAIQESENTIVCNDYALSSDEKRVIAIMDDCNAATEPTVRIFSQATRYQTTPDRILPCTYVGAKLWVDKLGINQVQYTVGNDYSILHFFDNSLTCIATNVSHPTFPLKYNSDDYLHCYDFKVSPHEQTIHMLVPKRESNDIALMRLDLHPEGKEWKQETVFSKLLVVPDNVDRVFIHDISEHGITYRLQWFDALGDISIQRLVTRLTNGPLFEKTKTDRVFSENATPCIDCKMSAMQPLCLVAVRSQDDYPVAKIFELEGGHWIEKREFKLPFTNKFDRIKLHHCDAYIGCYEISPADPDSSIDKHLIILLTFDDSLCIRTKTKEPLMDVIEPLSKTKVIECKDFILSEDKTAVAILYKEGNNAKIEVIKRFTDEKKQPVWKKLLEKSFIKKKYVTLQDLNATHVVYSMHEWPLADDDGSCFGGKNFKSTIVKRFMVLSLASGEILDDTYHSPGKKLRLPTFGDTRRNTNVTLGEMLGNIAYSNIRKELESKNEQYFSTREEQINLQLQTCLSLVQNPETKDQIITWQKQLPTLFLTIAHRSSFLTKIRVWARRWRNFLKPIIYLGNWHGCSQILFGLDPSNSKKMMCLKAGLGLAMSYPVASFWDNFLMCGKWQKDDQKWWNNQK